MFEDQIKDSDDSEEHQIRGRLKESQTMLFQKVAPSVKQYASMQKKAKSGTRLITTQNLISEQKVIYSCYHRIKINICIIS